MPNGLFVFDFAMPGRVHSSNKKNWKQDNWEMEVEHHEDNQKNILLAYLAMTS